MPELKTENAAIRIVRNFNNAWTAMDFDAIIGTLHEDIVYHNIPLTPIVGRAAVEDYLRGAWKFDDCEWELVNIAADGDIVLTERIDRFLFGARKVSLLVMGVFIVERGRIKVWRDYFDLADYRAQQAAAIELNGQD